MRGHSALLLLIVTLVAAAPQSADAGPRRDLDFETVYAGRVPGGLALTGDHVFRDEPSWCHFWAQMVRGVIPPPPCPPVDFHHETAIASIAAFACGDLGIQAIERAGSRRAVSVLVEERVCPCPLTVLIAVGHAVVVARPIGDVEFVHETIVDCSDDR